MPLVQQPRPLQGGCLEWEPQQPPAPSELLPPLLLLVCQANSRSSRRRGALGWRVLQGEPLVQEL